MNANPRAHPVLRWIGIAAGVLVLGIIAVIAFADWNDLRGPIARIVSARIGRPVHITGDLQVHLLSLTPWFKTELLVDETGLPGLYDVSFLLPRRGSRMEFTHYLKEFEKQLGLSIKRATMPLRVLVIEKAKRPLEN